MQGTPVTALIETSADFSLQQKVLFEGSRELEGIEQDGQTIFWKIGVKLNPGFTDGVFVLGKDGKAERKPVHFWPSRIRYLARRHALPSDEL